MSSGGDTPDTHTKEIIPKMDSKDQVDHADLSSQRASEKVESSKDCEGVTSKTESDSGFKDPSTGPVSQTDPNLDGSDEDLHLQWEDDDMDEQETVTKPAKTGIEEVKDAAKIPNIDEEVNENLLLENSDEIENTEDLADKIDDNSLTLAEDELLQADDDVIEPGVSVDSSIAKKDIKNPEMDKSTTEITLNSSNDNVQNFSDKESIQSNMGIDESKSMEKNDNNHLDTNDESIANIKSLGTSSPNESLSNTTLDLNLDHKLNRPDAMLEIPTQEIIDILDDSDLSVSFPKDDDTEKEVIEKTIDTPEAIVVTDEEKIEDNTVVLNTAEFEVDVKKQVDKEPKLSTVSEDDWTEIERRLEKFETSIVDETESNKVLTSDVVITEKLSSEVEVAGDGTIETNPSASKTLDQGNYQMEDIETVTEQRTSTSDSLIEKVSTSETIKDVQTNEDTVVANVESQTSVNVDQTVEAVATEISNDIQMSKPSLEKEDNLLVKEGEPASDAVTPPTSKTEHMESEIQMDVDLVDSNKPVDESLPIMETDEIAEVTTKLDAEDGTAESTESKDDETSLKLISEDREKTSTKDVAVVEPCLKSLTEEIPVSSQELSKQDTEVLQAVTSIIPIPAVETSNESSTNQDTVQLSDTSSSKPNTDTDLSLKPVKEGQQTETNSDVLTSNTESIDIPASSILKQETELEPQPSISKAVENQIEGPQTEINSDVLTSNTEIKDIPASSKQETEDPQPSTSKDVENQADVQLSTKEDFKLKEQDEVKSIAEVVVEQHIKPSSSMEVDEMPSTSKANDDDVKPSTSAELDTPVNKEPAAEHLAPDSSDEVSEVTDSLGLLAESSRVMEDDEEQEDDDDDDDDFYPEDESSNQMTAEHSEDSNQQHSETETKVGEKETDLDTPQEEKGQDKFNFDAEEKKEDGAIGEKDGDMEVDTVVSGAEDGTEKVESDAKVDEIPNDDEYESGSEKKTEEVMKDESVPEDPKQDIETVKLSDTSDTEEQPELLTNTQKDDATKKASEDNTSTPKVTKQRTQWPVMNYVDLEESSSEDDIQEVEKDKEPVDIVAINTKLQALKEIEVTDVSTSEDKLEETKPLPEAPPNVLSVSLITVPEPNAAEEADKPKHKFSLEIFNLDSDEEDSASQTKPTADKPAAASGTGRKCITPGCTTVTGGTVAAMCAQCATDAAERTRSIINGIKDLTPLLDLDIGKECTELVEISDSESEDEAEGSDTPKETIGEGGAAFIEAELAKAINETWFKFKMDSRLTEAQQALDKEMQKLEEETKEIDTMLNECQVATDQLRNDLYATFEQVRHDLNPLIIYDTPTNKYVCLETTLTSQDIAPSASAETRAKRRMSAASESSAKRPAIPLGYAPLDPDKSSQQDLKSEPTIETTKMDDDKDIAVLKVSAEAAPLDLPPPGELTRPPLRADGCVYAMRNTFGSWARARVLDVQGKGQVSGSNHNFTICRVRLVSRNQNKTKLLPARCLAYPEPADVRMTIGTRVIALFKDPMNIVKRDTFYSGIVAEVPNPVNNYRYLVFFDDGYAQYVNHRDTRLVCECSPLVWEEVHPFSREFVRQYLTAYPERPMVRLHAGQSLTTEWNGKWWTSRVIQVDASLVQVHFEEDNRTEWIYRGSTRLKPLYLELQAAERHRARPMPRTKAQARVNQPYVEYTRSDEQSKSEQPPPPPPPSAAMEREIRQRAVAKKSTTAPPPAPAAAADNVTSRVVYYTPKNAVKPYKMTPHTCGPHCKRKDTLALKDLRTYNPLAKPLLSGWERQIVRYNGHKEVMYRAPCGRRLRDILELHRYLRTVQSDMAVDLFDFTPQTHCLAEFVLNKCLVGKKDLSHGKENVPVPCVNYYDESLPEFCSYNTERTPTAGVPLNLDPEFLCGCDCTDDCEDKKKCACWQMTLEGARTIGLHGANVGYVYKRLPEPLPSGIYECNSRCKCKQTCLNRVAQHPLQLKLQVFKTLNRGWGIRALNDVPKGSFLCVYAGNLLTDATANMDGLNEGDEYLAELDYIEVVEQMKEGFEEDVPEKDKRLDKKNAVKSDEPETSSSEDEEMPSKNEEQDGDFCPGNIGAGVTEFSKRLRKRERNKKEKEEGAAAKDKEGEKADEDCITISDDEEVREPSRFMAQVGMESSEFVSKYRSVRSYFGKDEACYIMDAKVQGNIGRYLNHSCMPNVFVQNVFVDTHDPRFPWVAFFALTHIKAGTELTWNYNYDVGSVPGKALYCYCGAPTCRGRLL